METTKDAIHFEVERLLELTKKQMQKNAHKSDTPDFTAVQDITVAKSAPLRKEELRQYLAVLTVVLPEEKKAILEHAFTEVTKEDAKVVYESLDPQLKSALSFTLESYIAATKEKELYTETAEKLNALASFRVKEEIVRAHETLLLAEQEGDSEKVTSCLSLISKLQKEKNFARFTVELFA